MGASSRRAAARPVPGAGNSAGGNFLLAPKSAARLKAAGFQLVAEPKQQTASTCSSARGSTARQAGGPEQQARSSQRAGRTGRWVPKTQAVVDEGKELPQPASADIAEMKQPGKQEVSPPQPTSAGIVAVAEAVKQEVSLPWPASDDTAVAQTVELEASLPLLEETLVLHTRGPSDAADANTDLCPAARSTRETDIAPSCAGDPAAGKPTEVPPASDPPTDTESTAEPTSPTPSADTVVPAEASSEFPEAERQAALYAAEEEAVSKSAAWPRLVRRRKRDAVRRKLERFLGPRALQCFARRCRTTLP